MIDDEKKEVQEGNEELSGKDSPQSSPLEEEQEQKKKSRIKTTEEVVEDDELFRVDEEAVRAAVGVEDEEEISNVIKHATKVRMDFVQSREALENDVVRGYSVVDVYKLGKVRIYHPTHKELRAADNIYGRAHSRLLKENDYMLQGELVKILVDRGVLEPDVRKKMENLWAEVENIQEMVEEENERLVEFNEIYSKDNISSEKKGTLEEKIKKQDGIVRGLLGRISDKYSEIIELSSVYQRYMGMSIESLADYDRFLYLAALLVCEERDDLGEEERIRLWNSMDELDSQDTGIVVSVIQHVRSLYQALNERNLEELPAGAM